MELLFTLDVRVRWTDFSNLTASFRAQVSQISHHITSVMNCISQKPVQ